MRNIVIILAVVLTAWIVFHYPKADWKGQLASQDPVQISTQLPLPWFYKDFIIIPKAKYHIKAVILSKHHYWGAETEDRLSSYDLALGWGRMSEAGVINQLYISQGGRWYNYHWIKYPPIDPSEIIAHSSNNHIIAADQVVLGQVEHFKRYDVVDLEGYLVDIQSNKENWVWHTSLSRTDTGGGACEVFWVTSAFSL